MMYLGSFGHIAGGRVNRREHVTSRHATPRHVKSRHVTSRHVTNTSNTREHVTSRHVTSRHATSRQVTSRHVTSRTRRTHVNTSAGAAQQYLIRLVRSRLHSAHCLVGIDMLNKNRVEPKVEYEAMHDH